MKGEENIGCKLLVSKAVALRLKRRRQSLRRAGAYAERLHNFSHTTMSKGVIYFDFQIFACLY